MRVPGLSVALPVALTIACSSNDESGNGGTGGSSGAPTGGSAGSPGAGGNGPGGQNGTGGAAGLPSVAGSGGGAGAGSGGGAGASSGGNPTTGGAPSGGGTSGAAGSGASGGQGGTPATGSCLVESILTRLGKDSLLVGASMDDDVASSAPFDLRYLYLAGGVFDGAAPCGSCASGCTANGVSCANSVGCAWWGCWQYDQDPPGAYIRNFFSTATSDGQIPMLTYYLILQASGANEGQDEVAAANDPALMGRYLADFKFVLDQVGNQTVFLHIEPDFWGYAEQVSSDPHSIPAAVASASAECTGFENSIAGLGRCMISMVRAHAPNAMVGLHASGWGTAMDVLLNGDPAFDVAGEARELGTFLAECGAGDGDFIVVDAADRDAAYYESIGQDRWWDATNQTLPNFEQAFTWARALTEHLNVPALWWQVPVGNMALDNATNRWRDNRLDYFFDHMDEVAASNGFAIAYGAGNGEQTYPGSDDGHLVSRIETYRAAGGQIPCP